MPNAKRRGGTKRVYKPRGKVANTSRKKNKRVYKKTRIVKEVFPNIMKAVLSYAKTGALTTAATKDYTPGFEWVFSLNNICRPNFNMVAGDLQPIGIAQYKAAFNQYKTYYTQIKLELPPNTSTKQLALIVMFDKYTDVANTLISVTPNMVASMNAVYTYDLAEDKPNVFTFNVSIPRLEGMTSLQFKSDFTEYQGVIQTVAALLGGSAPKRENYFKMNIVNKTDNTVVNCPFEMNIKYHTTLFDKHRIVQTSLA